MDTCWAVRTGMAPGSTFRCKKRKWGGTDYCYQHAIMNGEALVVTPQHLITAVGGGPSAMMLWSRLKADRRK